MNLDRFQPEPEPWPQPEPREWGEDERDLAYNGPEGLYAVSTLAGDKNAAALNVERSRGILDSESVTTGGSHE